MTVSARDDHDVRTFLMRNSATTMSLTGNDDDDLLRNKPHPIDKDDDDRLVSVWTGLVSGERRRRKIIIRYTGHARWDEPNASCVRHRPNCSYIIVSRCRPAKRYARPAEWQFDGGISTVQPPGECF